VPEAWLHAVPLHTRQLCVGSRDTKATKPVATKCKILNDGFASIRHPVASGNKGSMKRNLCKFRWISPFHLSPGISDRPKIALKPKNLCQSGEGLK